MGYKTWYLHRMPHDRHYNKYTSPVAIVRINVISRSFHYPESYYLPLSRHSRSLRRLSRRSSFVSFSRHSRSKLFSLLSGIRSSTRYSFLSRLISLSYGLTSKDLPGSRIGSPTSYPVDEVTSPTSYRSALYRGRLSSSFSVYVGST